VCVEVFPCTLLGLFLGANKNVSVSEHLLMPKSAYMGAQVRQGVQGRSITFIDLAFSGTIR
jgi:hypothetical protein